MSAHTPLAILLELSEENRLTSDDFTRALNAAKVRATKPGTAPTKFADGGGLTLYVPPTGAKVWRYRYRLGGKEQILTVGAYPDVSLEHARVAHRAARWLVARGIHPLSYAEQEAKRRGARPMWAAHRASPASRKTDPLERCRSDGHGSGSCCCTMP